MTANQVPGDYHLLLNLGEADGTVPLDAVVELRQLSHTFAIYVLAWRQYVAVTMAGEDDGELEEVIKVINDCERHLSSVQDKMIQLGLTKFSDGGNS